MSEDSKTGSPPTTGKQRSCKMGCGFFGSEELSGCCSQCWKSEQRNTIQDSTCPTSTSKVDHGEQRENTSLKMCLLHESLNDKVSRGENPLPVLSSSSTSIVYVNASETLTVSPKQENSLKRKHMEGNDDGDDTNDIHAPTAVAKKQKRKKKSAYNAILSNILTVKEKSTVNDELNLMRQGLGGGAFAKVTKI